jgi:hypothetical protein
LENADALEPPPAPSPWRDFGAHFLFALVLAGLSLLLAWQVVPEVRDGELLDTDNYTRLLRVEALLESGAWYDNTVPRSNWPYGEVLHWTKPLDLLLAGGVLLLNPFMERRDALLFAGMLVSPFLLLLICFATSWASVPLAGARYRYFAMLAVLAQVGIVVYALPGRPDHHPLLLLAFVVSVGLFLRVLLHPFSLRTSLAAGSVAGLGLWTSPEFLVPLFLILATGVLAWVLEGGESLDRKNLWLSWGLVGTLILALLLERPPGQLLGPEYDRLSAVHLLVGLLALVFWGAGRGLKVKLRSPTSRLVFGALAGGGCLALLAMAYPAFFRGPTVSVDPRLLELWFGNVGDNQPMIRAWSLRDVGRFIVLLGPVAYCLPFVAWVLVRNPSPSKRTGWLLVGLGLGGLTGMSLVQVRFSAYAEILIVLAIAGILSRLLPAVNRRVRPRTRVPARALASSILITGCVFLGGLLMGLGGAAVGPADPASAAGERPCRILDLVPVLEEKDGLGNRPRTILTHVDLGPELLYRTRHRVLATPYHRNAQGILGAFDILTTTDLQEAHQGVESREVDLILLCPQRPALYSYRKKGEGATDRLFDRLLEGDSIPWVREVHLDPGTGFLLFQVLEGPSRIEEGDSGT